MPVPTRPARRRLLGSAVVALAVASAMTLLPNVAAAACTLGAAAAQSGRYFGAAVAAGASPLIANRTSIRLWEQFDLIG